MTSVVDQALPASVQEQQTSQQKNTALAYAVHVPVRTSSHPTVSSSRSSLSAPFAFVSFHPPGELNQSVFRFTSTVEGDLWSAIAAHTPKRRRARRLPDSVPDPRLSPRVHRPGSEAHGPGSLLSIPPLDPPDRREGKEGQTVPVARSDAMGFDRPRDACVSVSGGKEEDSCAGKHQTHGVPGTRRLLSDREGFPPDCIPVIEKRQTYQSKPRRIDGSSRHDVGRTASIQTGRKRRGQEVCIHHHHASAGPKQLQTSVVSVPRPINRSR